MRTVIQTARPALPPAPDYRQAARYLGVYTKEETTQALLERCAPALWTAAQPRMVWVCVPVEEILAWKPGRDIEAHLSGCHSVCLLAVTLGSGVDMLLRRLAVRDMAASAATDSLSSALIEQVCDEAEAMLRRETERQGMYLTGRFSPGYGDSSLELQPRFCELLETGRRIGLSVTDSLLMVPRKSVTAFLGIADHPVKGKLAGCDRCMLKDKCEYRKRGKTCATE